MRLWVERTSVRLTSSPSDAEAKIECSYISPPPPPPPFPYTFMECTGTYLYLTGQIRRFIENGTIAILYSIYISDLKIRKYCRSMYQAGRSGDRIPVGARFSSPVQTEPGAHPASCTMGTGRGEFRPRQTRQLPRAVDLKRRLLSCQSY